MKNLIFFCLLFIGTLIGFSCSETPDVKDKSKRIADLVEEHWSTYAEEQGVDSIGVALYIKRGEEVLFSTSGFEENFNEHTYFRAASTTKTFTGASILKLHAEGKLDINHHLTDTIPGTTETYLPASAKYDIPFKEEITIRMLLAHTAGIFDVTNNPLPDTIDSPCAGQFYIDCQDSLEDGFITYTKEKLLSPLAEFKIYDFRPGEDFNYSNTGFGILGIIVERVSGLELSDYKHTQLLTPLGMSSTYFATTQEEVVLPEPNVDYFLKMGDNVYRNIPDNLTSAQAEGNIVTTMADLSTWAYELYHNKSVIPASLVADMTTMVENNKEIKFYGLACEGNPPDIGIGHNGAHVGTLNMMRYDNNTGATYLIHTNYLNFTSFEEFLEENDVLIDIIREAQAVLE